ncbi:hypothetical protein V8F06_014745 [Rhypophila decipiens]
MNKASVKDYIENLDADSMTGNWSPQGTWHRIHGDCKSPTGGVFHLETMAASDGTFEVKLVKDKSSLLEYGLEYSSEPSFSTIVSDLKAKI